MDLVYIFKHVTLLDLIMLFNKFDPTIIKLYLTVLRAHSDTS